MHIHEHYIKQRKYVHQILAEMLNLCMHVYEFYFNTEAVCDEYKKKQKLEVYLTLFVEQFPLCCEQKVKSTSLIISSMLSWTTWSQTLWIYLHGAASWRLLKYFSYFQKHEYC